MLPRMLPLHYVIRHILRQPWRSLMVIVAEMLVLILLASSAAFQAGMERSMAVSGDAQNVIFMGVGSEESVERSEISAATPDIIAASIAGLMQEAGQIAVSGEVVYNGLLEIPQNNPSQNSSQKLEKQALFRGVRSQALQVHRSVRFTAGHFPGPGELAIGSAAAQYLGVDAQLLAIGNILEIEGQKFVISGHFIAPQSVLASEIWMDQQSLMALSGRETLSCAIARLDTATMDDIALFTGQRLDLELHAMPENEYYAKLMGFFQPIAWMVWISSLLIAGSACFGILTVIYAAYAARQIEFATLEAVGFSKLALALACLQESLIFMLCALPLSIVILLTSLEGLEYGMNAGVFTLQFDFIQLQVLFIAGLLISVIACLIPVYQSLRTPLVQALRG